MRGRRRVWAGADGGFRNGREIDILNSLRDRALAEHQAREGRPVVDSKLIGLASLASITGTENRT